MRIYGGQRPPSILNLLWRGTGGFKTRPYIHRERV